ncbi:hypothetical protein LGVB_01735 (plasmid) [Lactobacillus gasseri]|nr:hypothetical protein [Lactobacillus gasseri]MBS7525022.1 hypothetical protein [Lactobacillus gasseri]
MIQDIMNISSKSFDNYSSNDKFKNINIIFGANGSGKTSLARWLVENDLSNSRVFNSEYVQKNILTQDSLKGVKLTVGQTAVDVEKNIMSIKDANENIQNQINEFKRNLNKENDRLLTIMNDTLSKAKNHFDLSKKINQKKHAKDDPVEAFHFWINDIRPNLSIPNSSKELEQQLEIYRNNIERLELQSLISKDRFDKFSRAMAKPIPNTSENITNEIVEWISKGLKVHNMASHDEICRFCGNKFNGPEIAKKVEEKVNNEHAKYIQALQIMDNDLNSIKEKILTIKTRFDEFNTESVIKFIDDMREKIVSKVKDTSVPIPVSDIDFSDFSNFYDELQKKASIYRGKIKDINSQLSQIESVAKSWVGNQLQENNEIPKIIEGIQKDKELIEKYTLIIHENNKWISRQESETSDLKTFRDLSNHQFDLLGLNFRLEIMPDDQHYLVKSTISDKKLSTKDLSEGECRLLGFLQFYFDLFDKPYKSLAPGVDLIILDDPITSLDINNRYYLTELVNKLIKELSSLSSQLFIFTHSSLDFHNFGFNANKEKTEWFKISKNSHGNSSISIAGPDEKKNYSDYYQANFKDLFQFALIPQGKLPTDNYISYGNKARLLFESHARTHYRIEYTTNREHDKLKEFYRIPDNADEDFTNMLDVINSLSHGMTFADENPISSRELQRSIRFLFEVLYNKDRFHVEQMAGDLINKSNKYDILTWLSSLAK